MTNEGKDIKKVKPLKCQGLRLLLLYAGSSMGECFGFCGDGVHASLVTLLLLPPTPIDSTFCTPGLCIYLSGNPGRPTIGHGRPGGEVQLPLPLYRSVHLPSRLVEAQIPSNRRKVKLSPLYPGMVRVAPGEGLATSSIPVLCVPPWW